MVIFSLLLFMIIEGIVFKVKGYSFFIGDLYGAVLFMASFYIFCSYKIAVIVWIIGTLLVAFKK